jgi:hypothetical protein
MKTLIEINGITYNTEILLKMNENELINLVKKRTVKDDNKCKICENGFITDINLLPKNIDCFIKNDYPKMVTAFLENYQLVSQNLTKESLITYLLEQIKKENNTINEMIRYQNSKVNSRDIQLIKNRTSIVIASKEIIRFCNEKLNELTEPEITGKKENENQKTTIDIESFIKALFLDYALKDNDIIKDFVTLLKTKDRKTYREIGIIKWKSEQYLLLYFIENLKTHNFIEIDTFDFIIDNFSFPKKKIDKAYLQRVSGKYTAKSDKIKTEIEEKFNRFAFSNKPLSNSKLNIKTL